jgi:hypothetical protein
MAGSIESALSFALEEPALEYTIVKPEGIVVL